MLASCGCLLLLAIQRSTFKNSRPHWRCWSGKLTCLFLWPCHWNPPPPIGTRARPPWTCRVAPEVCAPARKSSNWESPLRAITRVWCIKLSSLLAAFRLVYRPLPKSCASPSFASPVALVHDFLCLEPHEARCTVQPSHPEATSHVQHQRCLFSSTGPATESWPSRLNLICVLLSIRPSPSTLRSYLLSRSRNSAPCTLRDPEQRRKARRLLPRQAEFFEVGRWPRVRPWKNGRTQ